MSVPSILKPSLHRYIKFSMTQLLTNSVAHSTKPSSRPETNNQPLKKFLTCVQLSESRQKLDVILENKVV